MPFSKKEKRMLRFHHIGIACEKINKVKEWIKRMYTIVYERGPLFDPAQNATVCLLRSEDGLVIELVSGEEVENIIKKGISFYHLCYAVQNIDEAIEDLKKGGAILFSPPKEAILFDKKKVAFLYTPMGVIELLEE